MTARVEEIRRQADDIINEWLDRDYAVAARPVPTKRERERLADRIATALAQAERERDEWADRHSLEVRRAEHVIAALARVRAALEYAEGWADLLPQDVAEKMRAALEGRAPVR